MLGCGSITPTSMHYLLESFFSSLVIISTFYPPSDDIPILNGAFPLHLGKKGTTNVFTRSYLFYGLEQAYLKYRGELFRQAMASNNNNNKGNGDKAFIITDPCLPKDMQARWNESLQFNQLSLSEQELVTKMNVEFIGSSNVEECEVLTQKLVANKYVFGKDSQFDKVFVLTICRIDEIQKDIPPFSSSTSDHTTRFIAFNGFYHVWRFFGLDSVNSDLR